MTDGDVLEIDEDERRDSASACPADYVYVDGLGIGDVDHVVLRDRQHLSTDGMVVVIVADRQADRQGRRPAGRRHARRHRRRGVGGAGGGRPQGRPQRPRLGGPHR